MVTTAASVEWTVVETEVEALQLEYSWIKEFDPRFNVKYRDDKSYPWLAVTLNEEFPRVMVGRGAKKKGVKYFGPYSHAWAIRDTVDLLLRVFPMRSCSNGVFKRHSQIGRPCLLGYIDKCSAPCVGAVSAEEHRQIVADFCDFLAGKTDRLIREMEQQMNAAAEDLDFERAARLRTNIAGRRRAVRRRPGVRPPGRPGARPTRVGHRAGRRAGRLHWPVPRRAIPDPVLRQPGSARSRRRRGRRRHHQPGAQTGAGAGAAR